MNLCEGAGKRLVLQPSGIAIPEGIECGSPERVARAFAVIGPCVLKAQVPAGKRGKAGGIRRADSATEASEASRAIFGMTIDGHRVESVLVEERLPIRREFFAAIFPDPESLAPVMLFSAEGGVDIEESAAANGQLLRRIAIDIRDGFDADGASAFLAGLDLNGATAEVADMLVRLYRAFRDRDAELVEINPIALLEDGRVVALDCKFVLDDAAAARQPELAAAAAKELLTEREARARDAGLKFIEFEGNVGILANGAGLTMTTMDAVRHYGGRPANFLEIGGEAYTKAETALGLVLANPKLKALVVNFCGAFARTDVMAEGVVQAFEKLKPSIPAFFSIHGTGEDEAVVLVRERLGLEPFDLMEDAVAAAVKAAS